MIPTIYIEKEPCISHSLSLSPPKVKVKVKSLTYGHKLIKELSTERTILSPFTKKKKRKKKKDWPVVHLVKLAKSSEWLRVTFKELVSNFHFPIGLTYTTFIHKVTKTTATATRN